MNDRDIVTGATQHSDPDARSAFLDSACAGDAALRARIERLLGVDNTEASLLNLSTPANDDGAARTIRPKDRNPDLEETRPPDEGESDVDWKSLLSPPQEENSIGRLDHYEVFGVIGRGGMGVVLKAHDTKLRRVVAVKLLAPSLAAVNTARRRFAREAQSAAAVREEHVVKIHTVCEDAKVPYLVMEFINGITLEDRIRARGRIDTREVLRIGMQSARGLAAAHAQGLVHRDVKPGNILLEDGVQRVKLTDFGLARAADDASISRSGVIAGTPMYMSPEQARGDQIDTRSDLFSLGSVLYTLCTGQPAFKADNTVAVLSRVCDDTPRPIREQNPDIPKWICAVIEKLMAKDAADRFASAGEVADLLARYQAHLDDPTRVPPPPPIKGVRVVRKRRLLKPAIAVLAAVIVVTLGVVLYQSIQPVHQNPPAKSNPVINPLVNWKAPTVQELAARPSPLDGRKRDQIQAELLALAGGGHPASAPSELVAILGDARFQLDRPACNLECSPDGRLLAVVGVGKVSLFDVNKGLLKREFAGTGRGNSSRVVFNSDGSLLLTPDEKETVRLWEVESGKLVQTYRGHTSYMLNALFGPGDTVITGSVDGTVRIFDAASGAQKHVLPHGNHVHGLAVNKDGTMLVTGCNDRAVRVWDLATGTLKQTLSGHTAEAIVVRFSPDGKLLATGSDKELKLWNADTFAEVRTLPARASWFRFTQDGSVLVCGANSAGEGGRAIATRWEVESGAKQAELPLLGEGSYHQFALSADDKTLFHIVDGRSSFVQVYDAITGKELFPSNAGEVWAVAVSPDGRTIASGGANGALRLWDLAGWKAESQPPVRFLTGHTATVYSVAFSPDGKLLASASQNGNVRFWDVATGESLRTLQGEASKTPTEVAFSADGKFLAIGDEDGSVRLWDVASGEERSPLRWHTQQVNSVGISPDNRFLASAGLNDRKVHITDLGTFQRVETLGPLDEARSEMKVAFGGDGRTLAYGGSDDTVHLWDLIEKKETLLAGSVASLDCLAVDPTGRYVAAARGGAVRFWDRTTPTQQLVINTGPFGSSARDITFTPEGRYLVVAGFNGTVSILRTPTPPPPYKPGPSPNLPTATELAKRPAPADALDQENLPPGMVALLGDDRFRLPKSGTNGCISQDREGKWLAIGNVDNVVILDARTGEVVRTLTGVGRMFATAISPDGKYVASANVLVEKDFLIRIWELDTGRLTAALKGCTGAIKALAFTSDGKRLLSAGDDAARVFNLGTGEAVQTLDVKAADFYQIAISHDGKKMVVGDKPSKTVRIFSIDDGKHLATLPGHTTEIRSAAFSMDGKLLATGSDTDLQLWDSETLKLVRKIDTPAGWLTFDPAGKSLLTAKYEQTNPNPNHVVTRWDLQTYEGQPLPSLSKRVGRTVFHLSPDGRILYSLIVYTTDNRPERWVRVYDAATGKEFFSRPGHGGQIWSVAASEDGKFLASAGDDGKVCIWDLASGKLLHALALPGQPYAVAFAPDCKTLAVGCDNGPLTLFDPVSGAEVRTLDGGDLHVPWFAKMSFSSDGTLLALAGMDGLVRVWDVPSGGLRRTFWAGLGPAYSTAFSPDGKVLAAGTERGGVGLWDLATGWQVQSFPKQRGAVKFVGFHPNGRSLAVGGLWRGDTLEPDSPKYKFTPTDEKNSGAAGEFLSKTYTKRLDAGQTYKFVMTSLDDQVAPLLIVDEAGDGKRIHSASAIGGNLARTQITITPTKTATCKIIACSKAGPGWFELTVQRGTNSAEWLGFGYVPVFDLLSGKETRLAAHSSGINAGTWRADGRSLFTVGDDGTLRMWDMNMNPPFARLLRGLPSGRVNGVALTPEGRYAAIASSDGKIPVLRLPDLPPPYVPGPPQSVPDPKILAAQPAAADALKRETIPADLLKLAGGGDPTRIPPPEVAAIFGDARFTLPKSGKNASMAQDKDGKLLAVANGNAVAVFNARTGELLRTLTGQNGRPFALAISPDGKYLAVGNQDGDNSIKVWDLNSGNVAKTLKAHTTKLWSLVFSPDGTRLISAANDGVKVWDLKTDKVIRTLEVNTDEFLQIGLSPDGMKIACGDKASKTVKVFEADSGKLLATLQGHANLVRIAAFSPDGKVLATGSDLDLLLWDAEKLQLVKKIETPAGWLGFDPDGKTLLTTKHDSRATPGENGQVVTRWDLKTFEGASLPMLSNRSGFTFFQLSPDGKTIYSEIVDGKDQDRSVRVYDAVTGKEHPRHGHNGQVFAIGFSPDGKRLASVGIDPGVRLWDAATGMLDRVLQNDQGFYHFAFSPDGNLIAAGEIDGSVVLYDANTGERLRDLPASKSAVRMVAFSPDGRYVVATTHAGVVNVWEVATGRLWRALAGRVSESWSVAFSPDGKTLATGWGGSEVILFDVATGWDVANFRVGIGEVRWLGFHPDGRSLGVIGVGSGAEQNLGVWDLATRKEIRRMPVPGRGHLGGAWRADGLLLASSGDRDGTVRLWNFDDKPEQQQVIQLLPPNTTWLHGLAFSPEGRHLATANPDGTISILRLAKQGEIFEPNPPALVSRDALVKHANPIKLLVDGLANAPDGAAKTKIISEAATIDGLLENLADRGVSDGQVQFELARHFAAKGKATLASAARAKARAWLEESLVKEPENAKFATDLAQVLIDERLAGSPIRWMALKPIEAKSTLGATFSLLPDDSILAGGPNPSRDTYRVVLQVPNDIDASAVRVEALTHPSLPKNGPGRAVSGSGAMASWKVTAQLPKAKSPINLSFVDAWADSGSPNHPVNTYGHWNLYGDAGHNAQAVWSMPKPVSLPAGTTLTFEIKCHTADNGENLGHFRLSVASPADSASLGVQQQCFSTTRLADPRAKLANGYTANDRIKEAIPYWVRAIERADGYEARKPILEFATRLSFLPAIADQLPDDSQVQLALARHLAELGKRHLAEEQPADALAELKQAREAYKRLPTSEVPWEVLKPIDMKSENGARMELENGNSIFVQQQQPPKNDAYTIVFSSEMKGITALRLEVFADSRLPNGGPGWGPTGNFQLNNFALDAAPAATPDKARKILLRNPSADYSQDRGNWDVRKALSKTADHGWGIHGAVNKNHAAVFELSEEVGDGQPTRLVISFNHPYKTPGYNVGRFRVSFTNAAKTLEATRIALDLKDSELFDLNLALGAAYAQQGQTKEAAASFADALPVADGVARGKIIAMAQPRSGVLEKLAELTADDGQFQAELARHFAASGNPEMATTTRVKARAWFQERLSKEPDNSTWAAELAQLLLDQYAHENSARWTVLEPKQMKSKGGAPLTKLDDHSILAGGVNPPLDEYTVGYPIQQKTEIRLIRLEAMTHDTLPKRGPGRGQNGQSTMTRWELTVNGPEKSTKSRTLTFRAAWTDFSYQDNPLGLTGSWNTTSGQGADHSSVWSLPDQVTLNAGAEILSQMRFQTNPKFGEHNLGRFRLSVSSDPNALTREQRQFAARKQTDPWAKLAAAYQVFGDQQALDQLLENHPAAAVGSGDLWMVDKDWERAIAAYSKVLTVQPANADISLSLAAAYQASGRTVEAIPHLVKASAANPKDSFLWLKLAALQGWFGQEKELATTRGRILAFAKGTTDANTANRAAKICCLVPLTDQAEIEEALALARTAVGVQMNSEWNMLALGMAQYRGGNNAAADEALQAVPTAGSKNGMAVGAAAFYRAMSLFRQGKNEEARMLAILTAVKMRPLPRDQKNPLGGASHDDLILWMAYREAMTLLKIDLSPIELLEQAVAIEAKMVGADNPSTLTLSQKLADAYVAGGRTRDAVPHLAKLSAANPKDNSLFLKVAALQAWFGQDKELASTRRRILAFAKDTSDMKAAEIVVKACCVVPFTDKAELEAVLTLGRTAAKDSKSGRFGWLALGMAEYRNGNDVAANTALLKVGQDGEPAWLPGTGSFYRAMILFRQGKVDEARTLATQVAAKMKPFPKDEKNPLYWTDVNSDRHADGLILWLAYKEAKALIKFETTTPPKADKDRK